MKTAIVTVGLGFGDEGKGAVVDSLCRRTNADLVVRYSGGAQAGHNVRRPDGTSHCFSQFGAGTLAGVPTYLGPEVVIDPLAMANEAKHLIALGVDLESGLNVKVNGNCLVATPYHRALNRAREIARGSNRHGSCGMGIGEARNYHRQYGEDAIFAWDLHAAGLLSDKLHLLAQRAKEAFERIEVTGDCRFDDSELAFNAVNLDPDQVAEQLDAEGWLFSVGPMPDFKTAIFEGSQGILLDEWRGFHPHTTWSTVTDHHARELAARAGVDQIHTIGITRAFTTRHGPGPLPTYSEELTKKLIDPSNPTNQWQGDFRVGHLDLPLLRYAISCCCGPIDGLAVSWLDRFDAAASVRVCMTYRGPVPIADSMRPTTLAAQELAGRELGTIAPLYDDLGRHELLEELKTLAPIVMEGYGPCHEDWASMLYRLGRKD